MNFKSLSEKLKFESIPILQLYSYAAVAIIINDRNEILVEKRSEKLDDPWAGQFAFPGGHHESSDGNLINTVIREVMEETGLNIQKESILGYFGPFSPMNKLDLLVYVFVAREGINAGNELIKSEETDFLGWIPISVLEKGKTNMDGEVVFRIPEGIIWGMSARILDKFLKILETN